MLRGLWRLTWLEIKIFVREPLGVIGTIGVPVLVFIVARPRCSARACETASPDVPRFVSVDLPIFASLLIAASAVLSLVAIVAIYREGGILKRLRATPLAAHDDSGRARARQAAVHGGHAALMILAGRAQLPGGSGCSRSSRSRWRCSSARQLSCRWDF